MYQAMIFHPVGNGKVTVRSVRLRPYSELKNAVDAVVKSGHEGYVKMQGRKAPVWNNVRSSHV